MTVERPVVIGFVRMHCYRNGVLNLVFVEKKAARDKRIELSREGWVVTHTEFV